MMNETGESLGSSEVPWSAEALDFVKAISSRSPDELSDVSVQTVLFQPLLTTLPARIR